MYATSGTILLSIGNLTRVVQPRIKKEDFPGNSLGAICKALRYKESGLRGVSIALSYEERLRANSVREHRDIINSHYYHTLQGALAEGYGIVDGRS